MNPTTGELYGGSGELPGRPASETPALAGRRRRVSSRGVYYPSPAYPAASSSRTRTTTSTRTSARAELAWNRGGSQQDEKEFKEGYLDMEFFDSRLWVRAGKQNVVWGKTELFRTTDQFNPVDLALASLPSLEESRIALWSVRGVWSFYDVGPLEDVRLEVAVNLDDIEPVDIGQCGEPFTALVACNKRTALWAHGITGYRAGRRAPAAVAGGTARAASSTARASSSAPGSSRFQVSDYFGYDDFPYVNRINSYERNVDPDTGRPRRVGREG